MDEKKYLTVKEFAEQAGIRRQGLYKAYSNPKSKIYPYVRIEGKNVYISKEALTAVYGVVSTADNEPTPETTEPTPETTEPTPETTEPTPETTEPTPETTQQPPISPMESQVYKDYISHLEQEIVDLKQSIQKKDEQIIELTKKVMDISNQALIITKQEQHLTYLDKAQNKTEEGEPIPKRSLLKRLFRKECL